MKQKYLLVALLFSATAMAQAPRFTSNGNTDLSFFGSDSLQVTGLNMLGKLSSYEPDADTISPEYNRTKSVRRLEAIKKMSLEVQQQDRYGRELPPDAFQMARNEVIWRNMLTD
ncbi:MAG TPA: hypothetical protein VF676_13005 [Flavobacterium sp.]|jgi:hypothetical protein